MWLISLVVVEFDIWLVVFSMVLIDPIVTSRFLVGIALSPLLILMVVVENIHLHICEVQIVRDVNYLETSMRDNSVQIEFQSSTMFEFM